MSKKTAVFLVIFVLSLGSLVLSQSLESKTHEQIDPLTGKWEKCADSEGILKFMVCHEIRSIPDRALPYKSINLKIVFPAGSPVIVIYDFFDSTRKLRLVLQINEAVINKNATNDKTFERVLLISDLFKKEPPSDQKTIDLVVKVGAANGTEGTSVLTIPLQ